MDNLLASIRKVSKIQKKELVYHRSNEKNNANVFLKQTILRLAANTT